MNEKTLKILEFDKIINMIVNLTSSPLGAELAAKLMPETDYGKVLRNLKETSDGVTFIVKGRSSHGRNP